MSLLFKFKHTSLIGNSLGPRKPFYSPLLPAPCCPCSCPRAGGLWRLLPAGSGCSAPVRRGGRGGGGGGGAGCCVISVGVLRKFCILLVLEFALDYLGLGATAGALNPLDVLVTLVGCQDCLQLRVCYLKESGSIWVYTSTITLSCWSACALKLSSKGIEIGSMMRALGCDYILTSSNQHHFVRSYSAHDNSNENSSPELKNTPNWIVDLTELHEKSIKNQIREMNK